MTALRWWAVLVALVELTLAAAFFYYTMAITQAVNQRRRDDDQISYVSGLLRNVPLLQEYERLYPEGTLARTDRIVITSLLVVVILSLVVRLIVGV